ncbi:MAG: FecR family protein [Flavobacteriaceae bacterium]|nr:FecR family protein [Flavobacteriaceae bacterium]
MKKNYFLAKWLNGELTEEQLLQYISQEEIDVYKKIAVNSQQFEVPDYDVEVEHSAVLAKKSSTKIRKPNFMKPALRIAAMIAVFFTAYYYFSNTKTIYTTNLAEKIDFELPDQSTVYLNASSEISFSEKKWKKNRELKLKGEAYFSVKKGSKFTVKTENGSVSVLGTKFNVVVRDHFFEVQCFEGLVSASYQGKSVKIPAGSSLKVLNSKSEFFENQKEMNPSWLINKSTFERMPFSYVINELERQYNLKVVYNSEIASTLFTGNFTHTNLELALKAVCIPLNLNYTVKKGIVTLEEK